MEEGLRLSMAVCSSSRTWSLRVPTPSPNFSQGHGSGLLTAELPDIESWISLYEALQLRN